jgi:hypothetical protein
MTTRQLTATALTLGLVTLSSYALRADVRTDEKTRMELGGALGRFVGMFAGKAAKEGITTSVAVKGNRAARMNEDTGQIIDLTEEKVYELDLKKKSYKVTTFAEMRRQMEEAQKKAQEQAAKAKASEKPAEPQKQQQPQVEVDFNLKNTGEKKTVNGYETREQVMTITVREKGKTLEEAGGIVLTADQWIAPPIPAMKEVGEFYMKFFQKVYGGSTMMTGMRQDQMATIMAMYPMMKDAMGKMTTEGQRIQGTPILTTTTFEAVKSAAEVAQETQAGSGGGDDNNKKTPTSIGGLLGGIGRRAAAKKASGGDQQQQGDKSRATIMTSTTEVLKVVTDVSASDVAIPAGFKENK